MSTFLPTVRRALVIVASTGLVALSACVNGRRSADSPGAAANLPGALTKPMEQYTADEFYGFVHALTFSGGVEKPRRCRSGPSCNPPAGKQTTVRVDAVDGQDSLSVNAIPRHGAVEVRASNTGLSQENRYGMLPGPYEYYVVVLPGTLATNGNATWRMHQLKTTAGERSLTQIATGVFQPCHHPYQRSRTNRANFYTCTNSPVAGDSTIRKPPMQGVADDPIWVGCAQGCCLAM